MNINVILYVLTIDFLAIMSPGPDFFMVLRNTLTNSLRAGFYTTIGITLGSTINFMLGMFGVGVLIIHSKITFGIIKYLGATYLTYLALKSIFSKVQISESSMVCQETKPADNREYFKVGLFCNLTNPKAFLFIVSLSTYVAERGNPIIDGWFILLGSGVATLLWFTFVSFMFGRASIRKVLYAKQKIISIIFGLILLYVASRIIIL